MRRRRTLQLFGTAAVTALAGCSSHAETTLFEGGERALSSGMTVSGTTVYFTVKRGRAGDVVGYDVAADDQVLRIPGAVEFAEWDRDTPIQTSAPVVRGGAVYLTGREMISYAVDGERRWRVDAVERFGAQTGSQFVGEERLFVSVAGQPSTVCAFERESGDLVWRTPVEGGVVDIEPFDGALVVGTNAGSVVRLDPETGEFRPRPPAGNTGTPVDLTVAPGADGSETVYATWGDMSVNSTGRSSRAGPSGSRSTGPQG